MAGVLATFFASDLGCDAGAAELLAQMARERVPVAGGSPEDTDEDLVVRLSDPRTFGAFAGAMLSESRLAPSVRTALAEHVFDLLPLPRTEGDVIVVEARSPPDLLTTARFLARGDGLTVLHAMHLLYAVFLDRSLVDRAPRDVRREVLLSVLRLPDTAARTQVVYACLHLAHVPLPEAHSTLRQVLRDRSIAHAVKRPLAQTLAAQDARGGLARLAREEGLLPSAEARDDPATLANIPSTPPGLAAEGRRWLAKHAAD